MLIKGLEFARFICKFADYVLVGLRDEVCRVGFPLHLSQLNGGIFDTLLNPQGARIDVAQLAQSAAATYAQSSGRVRLYSEWHLPSKVFQ